MDVGGWFFGFVASLCAAILLALVGAITRWRHRDQLRGASEIPSDLTIRFVTRGGIVLGLVLLTLVVAATYYGLQQAGASVFGVPGSPLAWAILTGLWAVVLWQLVRGRLKPYPGGWSGVTTCAIFWIFPVGPFAMVWLITHLGHLVDRTGVPGKGVLPYLLLGLLYLAVPVIAFRLQNLRRRSRSEPRRHVGAPARASG